MNGRLLLIALPLVLVAGSLVMILGHIARPGAPPKASHIEKMAAAMAQSLEHPNVVVGTTSNGQQQQQSQKGGGDAAAHAALVGGASTTASPTFTEKVVHDNGTTLVKTKRVVQPFYLPLNSKRFPWLPSHANADKGVMIMDGIEYEWEVLSKTQPRAFLIRGLLTPQQAESIRKMAAPSLERSTVIDLTHGKAKSKVDAWRTSKGMFFITPEQESLLANRLYRQRIAKFLGLQEPWLEKTQVLNYHPGEYYRPHEDFFAANDMVNLNRGGQRVATAIVYLNHIKGGGETAFPRNPQGLKVRPNVGDAVVFYSVDPEGNVDPYSLHEGRPPEEGSEKWIAVLWCHPKPFF